MSVKLDSAVDAVINASNVATREGRIVTAANIAAEAEQLAPVESGELANSIGFGEIDENAAHASAGVEYAIYPEFGTKNQAAQPYMRPARVLAEGKNVEDVKKIIVNQVENAAEIRKELFDK